MQNGAGMWHGISMRNKNRWISRLHASQGKIYRGDVHGSRESPKYVGVPEEKTLCVMWRW